MPLISNGDTTRERNLTLNATISQALSNTQTLHLYKDSIDVGVMSRIDDFTYTIDISYFGPGDPEVLQRFLVQAQDSGNPIANSVLYEMTYADPPRSEILTIEEPIDIDMYVPAPVYDTSQDPSFSARFDSLSVTTTQAIDLGSGQSVQLTRTGTYGTTVIPLSNTNLNHWFPTNAEIIQHIESVPGGGTVTYTAQVLGHWSSPVSIAKAEIIVVPTPGPTGSYILMESDGTPMLMESDGTGIFTELQ